MISALEPGDGADFSIEQSPENQASATSKSLDVIEAKGNNVVEKSNNGKEIVTPTDDPTVPPVAQPKLDPSGKDVLDVHPQAIGEEPGEGKQLMEDTTGNTSKNKMKVLQLNMMYITIFLTNVS